MDEQKIPVSAASMSRQTITAYLTLYLKNRRKKNSCNKGLIQNEILFNLFNPFLHIGHYSVRMAKFSILK